MDLNITTEYAIRHIIEIRLRGLSELCGGFGSQTHRGRFSVLIGRNTQSISTGRQSPPFS